MNIKCRIFAYMEVTNLSDICVGARALVPQLEIAADRLVVERAEQHEVLDAVLRRILVLEKDRRHVLV